MFHGSKKIVSKLEEQNIFFDKQVTIDPWRVLRVPGTLHGDTGLIAKWISNLSNFSIDDALL